jgi:hypothetical protein
VRYQEDVFTSLSGFKPQELTNVLWSLAQLNCKIEQVSQVRASTLQNLQHSQAIMEGGSPQPWQSVQRAPALRCDSALPLLKDEQDLCCVHWMTPTWCTAAWLGIMSPGAAGRVSGFHDHAPAKLQG